MATANKQVGDVEFTIGSDPRKTAAIEESAVRDFQRRFRELRGTVRRTVGYEHDALGLTTNQAEEQSEFDAEDAGATLLVAEFINWLRKQLKNVFGLFLSPTEIRQGQHWFSEYLESAVEAGVDQSTGLLFQAGIDAENVPTTDILDQPRFANVLNGQDGRYVKAFDSINTLSNDLTSEARQITRDGIRRGKTPRELADELTQEIRKLEKTRATTIARTETAVAHTESSLANYRKSGVAGVGHVGRVTAGDLSVCAFCRRIRDEVYTLQEFRRVVTRWRGKLYRVGIPSHPNGRCVVVPRPDVGITELPPLAERVPGTIINS